MTPPQKVYFYQQSGLPKLTVSQYELQYISAPYAELKQHYCNILAIMKFLQRREDQPIFVCDAHRVKKSLNFLNNIAVNAQT